MILLQGTMTALWQNSFLVLSFLALTNTLISDVLFYLSIHFRTYTNNTLGEGNSTSRCTLVLLAPSHLVFLLALKNLSPDTNIIKNYASFDTLVRIY